MEIIVYHLQVIEIFLGCISGFLVVLCLAIWLKYKGIL